MLANSRRVPLPRFAEYYGRNGSGSINGGGVGLRGFQSPLRTCEMVSSQALAITSSVGRQTFF